jgi:hypothetical protein
MIIDRFFTTHLTTDHVRKRLRALIEKPSTKKTPAKIAAKKGSERTKILIFSSIKTQVSKEKIAIYKK